MKSTMRYAIASGLSIDELERDVADHLIRGWRPQGGVCDGERKFYQAMVLEEEV